MGRWTASSAGDRGSEAITTSRSAVAAPDRFSDRRALIDGALLIGLCAVFTVLVVRFNMIEGGVLRARASSGAALDAAVALLVSVPIATTVFARRRYRDVLGMRRELVHISLHDDLTGLPNRRLLSDWLGADILRSQERNSQAAVLFVDLDRFKMINDTYGHEIGDRLMRAVGDRMRATLDDAHRLLRFGGDEFVILCADLNGKAAAEKLAHRVIAAVEAPFTLGGESMRISASIGIALAEHRGVKPDEVLRDADVAMYQAKASGAGQVLTFDRSMRGALTPATAEEQIRTALEAGEFRLNYQPVVDLTTGRIVGAEALLRWATRDRGQMSPGDFIPILEETGLIVPVGTWVLQEACREVTRLRHLDNGVTPITITVNVSARQIAQVNFTEVLADAMAQAGVGPGQIHLEITEGALMHDVSSAWAALRQAKAHGVKLALDDFGTGYSSLSYVRRFSLDMLKIDKSFIDGLDSSPEDRAIVEHVVAMAKALGMTTVAEGVERPEQLAWLRRLGCCLAQGYVLSRPISATDLEELLVRRHETPFEIEPSPHPPPKPEHQPLCDPWEAPATAPVRLPEAAPTSSAAATGTGTTKARPGLPRLREYRPPASIEGNPA